MGILSRVVNHVLYDSAMTDLQRRWLIYMLALNNLYYFTGLGQNKRLSPGSMLLGEKVERGLKEES